MAILSHLILSTYGEHGVIKCSLLTTNRFNDLSCPMNKCHVNLSLVVSVTRCLYRTYFYRRVSCLKRAHMIRSEPIRDKLLGLAYLSVFRRNLVSSTFLFWDYFFFQKWCNGTPRTYWANRVVFYLWSIGVF